MSDMSWNVFVLTNVSQKCHSIILYSEYEPEMLITKYTVVMLD